MWPQVAALTRTLTQRKAGGIWQQAKLLANMMWLLSDAGYRQGTLNLHVSGISVKDNTTQEATCMHADITHPKYAGEKLWYDTQNTHPTPKCKDMYFEETIDCQTLVSSGGKPQANKGMLARLSHFMRCFSACLCSLRCARSSSVPQAESLAMDPPCDSAGMARRRPAWEAGGE